MPALRHRTGDIPLLAQFFLEKYRAKYNKPDLQITDEALEKLSACPWHGNVRELQHTIEKAVILNDGYKIAASDLFLHTPAETIDTSFVTLEDMEKNMIAQCMQRHSNNLSAAAAELGITRQTLYNKIKKYQIN